MKTSYLKKPNFWIGLLVLSLLVETVVIFGPEAMNKEGADQKLSYNEFADQVMEKCKDANYRPACYDEEIPKLTNRITMEEAFEVTKIIQTSDQSYPYCHVLGHELSAQEVRKNPDDWKQVVTRCPSGVCSNGCIHGGFQERFRAEYLTPEQVEELKPELASICERRPDWNPTGLEQGSCYHALGHLTMYLTQADINQSVRLCNEVAKKADGRDFSQLCYDGAFMQIFQPLEAEDFTLIEGKEIGLSQVLDFCRTFETEARSSCWSESWPLVRSQVLKPQGLVQHCSNKAVGLRQVDADRCFSSLVYVVTSQMEFKIPELKEYCADLPQAIAGVCFSNVASRLIETDYRNISKSVDVCSSADNESQDKCFNELLIYSNYNFHSNSPEFQQLCNALPGEWKNRCVSRGSI
ncbi:MAG TPA: hypothetical protein VD998_01775 [Verrucomicrobiae bacterium]|nr:hypothetical protein [Verrucomicrobiae bacterium]